MPVPAVKVLYGYGKIAATEARVDPEDPTSEPIWDNLGPDAEVWIVMQWFHFENGDVQPGNFSYLRPECSEADVRKSMERMEGMDDITREQALAMLQCFESSDEDRDYVEDQFPNYQSEPDPSKISDVRLLLKMTTFPFVKRDVPSADLIDLDYGYNNVFHHTTQDTIDKLAIRVKTLPRTLSRFPAQTPGRREDEIHGDVVVFDGDFFHDLAIVGNAAFDAAGFGEEAVIKAQAAARRLPARSKARAGTRTRSKAVQGDRDAIRRGLAHVEATGDNIRGEILDEAGGVGFGFRIVGGQSDVFLGGFIVHADQFFQHGPDVQFFRQGSVEEDRVGALDLGAESVAEFDGFHCAHGECGQRQADLGRSSDLV